LTEEVLNKNHMLPTSYERSIALNIRTCRALNLGEECKYIFEFSS